MITTIAGAPPGAAVVVRARVLVADDEPDIVEMLAEALVAEGYEVTTAATGLEALAAAQVCRPDVIVLDLSMPGISGAEVLVALARDYPAVPVLVASARPELAPTGAFGVLAKPFDLAAVPAMVAAAVTHRRRQLERLGKEGG